MFRAFKLEWLKLKHYRFFWILMGMYLLALFIICTFGVFFLEWLKRQGADFDGIDPTLLPIYDFPDIWQNTTYLASFLKVLLAFIVIISVTNDVTYLTMRQNIIDGISKKEFLLSKLSLVIFLALTSTVFLFIFGFINGSIYSHVWGPGYIFDELEFLVAYMYDIIVFCSFALILSLIIKKAGFAIVLLFLYSLMFEPILTLILIDSPWTRETAFWPEVAEYFPIKAMNGLIPVPYPKYIFREIVDDVPWKPILISTGWLAIFQWSIYRFLVKRDLK
jgi:ABC-2 type transport system permease protein